MRTRIALLCAMLLTTAAIAAEPPVAGNRLATPAQPKSPPVEEVVVTAKRPQLDVPPAIVAPVVRVPPPSPCIEIGTKRCGSS